jgi:hypothetical protein
VRQNLSTGRRRGLATLSSAEIGAEPSLGRAPRCHRPLVLSVHMYLQAYAIRKQHTNERSGLGDWVAVGLSAVLMAWRPSHRDLRLNRAAG